MSYGKGLQKVEADLVQGYAMRRQRGNGDKLHGMQPYLSATLKPSFEISPDEKQVGLDYLQRLLPKESFLQFHDSKFFHPVKS